MNEDPEPLKRVGGGEGFAPGRVDATGSQVGGERGIEYWWEVQLCNTGLGRLMCRAYVVFPEETKSFEGFV